MSTPDRSHSDPDRPAAADRELAREKRRLELVVQGTLDPLITIDGQGTIQSASDSCERVFGYAPRDLLGENVKLLMPEPYRSEHDGYLRIYRTTGHTGILGRTREFPVLRKDGGEITCALSVSRIDLPDDDGPLFCGTFRDVTETQHAEQRQQAMLSTLAEIGEAASLLAHEIKNPITAVNLALRAVAKHLGEDEQAVLTDLVDRMQKLERLMRRTLSFARTVDPRRIPNDPRQRVEAAVAGMQGELDAHGVVVEVVGDPGELALYADPALVEELLTNLLRNALEALAARATGRVRVECRREAEVTSFLVDDDGPGVDPALEPKLFQAFVTTKDGAAGIGLALARKVAEAHGGDLRAEGSPLGGARFVARFPDAD